jgi:ribonuclease E
VVISAPVASDDAPVRSYFSKPAAPMAQAPSAVPLAATDSETTAPAVAPAIAPAAAPTPAAVATPVATPAAAAPASSGMPKVQSYRLPLADLASMAANSGLQWVNSDADKVAQVQAAIAAEPKPVHVPREPKPVVVVDEGPLVLVETRKDLRQVQLAFEQQGAA